MLFTSPNFGGEYSIKIEGNCVIKVLHNMIFKRVSCQASPGYGTQSEMWVFLCYIDWFVSDLFKNFIFHMHKIFTLYNSLFTR